ncbi:MAG: universal stress protein [Rhodopirellula sp.]|nr:universal stress protein [Rhodopirellula sp.]
MLRFNRILVPVDFSRLSKAIIEAAVTLADRNSSQLFLIHALAPVAVLPPLAMAALPGLQADDNSAVIRQLENLLVPDGLYRLPVHREVIPGDPERVIPKFADEHDIDVIVMGTHSRTGLAHFVLGSVTEAVVRRSKCPVLTVPAGAVEEQT